MQFSNLCANKWSKTNEQNTVNIIIITNVCKIFIFQYSIIHKNCSVGWGFRMHRLLLCRRIRPHTHTHTQRVSWVCDTKQCDSEVLVMLELWAMPSTTSLPLLQGPLWPRVIAPARFLSMGQIKTILMLNWIFKKIELFWQLTVRKQNYTYSGWNDKIVEKMTWFHFRLMKTGFLFLLQTIY